MSASKETRPAATAGNQGSTVQGRLSAALQGAAPAASAAPTTPARQGATAGAAAAAGVLTAVDEDEGVEEAPVPDEFTYETEGEDEEL